MFTVQKGRVPRLFMKNIGATGTAGFDFDRTQWPFSSPTHAQSSQVVQDNKEDSKEIAHHLRTLGPIMSSVGIERIELVKKHTYIIIALARATPVIVEKNTTNVLDILLKSTLGRKGGDYSVVGHEAVAGLRHFVDTELTLTKLNKI